MSGKTLALRYVTRNAVRGDLTHTSEPQRLLPRAPHLNSTCTAYPLGCRRDQLSAATSV